MGLLNILQRVFTPTPRPPRRYTYAKRSTGSWHITGPQDKYVCSVWSLEDAKRTCKLLEQMP